MKKLILIIFLLRLSFYAYPQDLKDKLAGSIFEAGREIPSDQLFLHLDRNLYHPHDTIRFQAYIRDSRTGIFGTESSALYVLLINSDHSTLDSARFRIIYPAVPGWLTIPDKTGPGDYSVLAFTSSDMNFSPKYAFSTPIKIDNLLPYASGAKQDIIKPATQNDQVPYTDQTIDLRFLPEGGTFIYGVKQRLAFNAVTSSGKSLKVSGGLLNQKGERILEFSSDPCGPGLVEFTPLEGDTYFATISGEEFKGMKWPLPVAEQKGVAMRVNKTGEGLIEILLSGRNTGGRTYFLTVEMNNVPVFSGEVKVDSLLRKRIRTDRLPSGTAYISLYDHELNPVAERLIFLNDHKKMNVRIGVSSPFYFKGDETELTVTTADENGTGTSSILSVAVIDSASGYSNTIPQSQIESEFMYGKEFYDNLPERIRNGGLKSLDSESHDLLMLTYGWRRFSPKEVIHSPQTEMVNYDFLTIKNPGPMKKGRSEVNVVSDFSPEVISLEVNSNREALLYYDSLDANIRQIMILPDKVPDKNINPVRVAFPENRNYTDRAKLLADFPVYLTSEAGYNIGKQPDIKLDDYIMIEPVTIKAPPQPVRPKIYIDRNAKMYQSTGAATWYRKDFGAAYTLEDLLYKYNPWFLDNNQKVGFENQYIGKVIYLRYTTPSISVASARVDGKDVVSFIEKKYPALFVIDNNPIGFTYDSYADLPVSEIASITFLRGKQGVPMYGNRANGGVVFITTRIGSGFTADELDKMNEPKRNDDLFKQIRLFRTETEFYIPPKELVASDPGYQFRSTVLWKDLVITDSTGSVKIRYPNNMVKGTAIVVVNGISLTNLVGSARFSYEVK